MARIRSIHPGLTSDEAYMSMSMTAKAGWTPLWMQCDDHGIFEWKPIVLKALIFPADAVDFNALLDEWLGLDCIKRVEVEGKPCGIVRNFAKYQRPKNPSYRYFKDNNLPVDLGSYTSVKGVATPALPQPSGSTPEIPPQMKEEGGCSRVEEESKFKERALFDDFWNAYPRRDEAEQRDRAETEFAKLIASGVDPAVITFNAKAYCAKIRKQNSYATKFVKVAWRWLGEQDFTGAAPVLVHSDAPFEPAEKDWRAAVQRFIANESSWPRWAGNAPGTRSCRCPAGILAEEGICPNTGLRITATWWFAEEDTPELRANLSFAADHKLKVRLYDITKDGVTKQNGAYFVKRIPPGYDEATGERIPPSAEDAA